MGKYKEIDLTKIKSISIDKRKSKVSLDQNAHPVLPGSSFKEFWDSLPNVLKSKDLRELAHKITLAVKNSSPVILMMGAHVIKTGLNPVIIDLMENGVIQGLVMNGACCIHDVELAFFGKTSEHVSVNLKNGTFGMVKETADIINTIARKGYQNSMGFGEAAGKTIQEKEPSYMSNSIIGQAYKLGIPVTIHVALGTDIVHQHPSCEGSAIGDISMRDFRILANMISKFDNNSVVLLFGSAVILPEVFVKALSIARNISGKIKGFTTACFDMKDHYRVNENVLKRPVSDGGKSYKITGHHEIMIPLFAAVIKEKLDAVSSIKRIR
ncbi:MAG: hypothetical protein R6V04_15850 [bacterium]